MTDLKWHEPAAYRRAAHRVSLLESIKFAAIVFVVVIGIRGLVEIRPNPNPNRPSWAASVLIAAAAAVFFAFGFPALLSFLPNSIVILSRKGVNNNIVGKGAKIHFWPWDEIASCAIATESFGQRGFRTLSLLGANGTELATFGMAEQPTNEEIAEFLRAHGKLLRIEPSENA